MTTQLEREDVALPQLIGLSAFEPTRWFVTRVDLLTLDQQALLVEDAPHGRL